MAVTSTDIVNEALQIMGGNQPPVTGVAPNFDDSPSGKVAAQIYLPAVASVARQFEWDFARRTVLLVASGNAPPFPWAREYVYPANGIQVWQITPTMATDVNDPLPVNYVIANAQVSGNQVRVIHTNLSPAQAIYNNNPTEADWDALFREAVVRLLASEFAMAIGGKPDASQALLESGSAFESIGEARQN